MMDTTQLKEILNRHAENVKDPYTIFELAKEYDNLKQGAAAVGLYIKAADLTDDKILQYKCMILAGECYRRQGNRMFTVLGMFQDAVNTIPNRPEGHYFLASYYEQRSQWKECLMHAQLGLGLSVNGVAEDDPYDIGYPGKDWFYVQEAISHWFLDGVQSSRERFFELAFWKDVKEEVKYDVIHKLNNVVGIPDYIYYKKENPKKWKFPFDGIETINNNYSKHFQDMFVLSVLNGKKNGTYLEVGSGHPTIHNNTYLLEQLGWKGVSIDNNKALSYEFSLERNNTALCLDATKVQFKDVLDMLSFENKIDYLQIDCDESSLDVLKQIPFNSHTFGVITYEHDAYRLGQEGRDAAREIFYKHDYKLLVPNVSFWNENYPYEDWYVHRSTALKYNLKEMISEKEIVFVWDYFYDN